MQYQYAIVITGGIAVGKSTVKSLLYLNGYRCIDADLIAHKILDESYKDISVMFGREYVDDKQNPPIVNRKKLGQLVFLDIKKKLELEQFIHPKINEEIQRLALIEEKREFTYFIDIPLFFETKNYEIKKSLLVYAPKETQLIRLMKRDKIDKTQALARINAQMDIEQKRKLATYIVDNSKDLKHLQHECDILIEKIS